MGRVKYYKRMWLQAGNETTRRRLPVCQHRQRPDYQSKITWNQVCVFDSFSSAKLYQQRISRLHCYEKRFKIFPRDLSCQSSYFRWKLIDLFFSAVSGVEIKNLQRSEQAHFLVSRLRRALVLQREPARRLEASGGGIGSSQVSRFALASSSLSIPRASE